MRSTPPVTNATLLRIQKEINDVAERENELRNVHINDHQPNSNGLTNGTVARTPSPVTPPPPPPVLTRAVSTSALNTNNHTPPTNGVCTRRFIPNSNARGVMQKFFKNRGKITQQQQQMKPILAWQPGSDFINSPAKVLIPPDKPLRKGYVPVEERIQKELREMRHREDELKTQRRKSQTDLFATEEDSESSRSSSPTFGLLRPARSYSQLLADEFSDDIVSAPASLRPARSLADLCDAADDEIESPRTLIQHWESRIKQCQGENGV